MKQCADLSSLSPLVKSARQARQEEKAQKALSWISSKHLQTTTYNAWFTYRLWAVRCVKSFFFFFFFFTISSQQASKHKAGKHWRSGTGVWWDDCIPWPQTCQTACLACHLMFAFYDTIRLYTLRLIKADKRVSLSCYFIVGFYGRNSDMFGYNDWPGFSNGTELRNKNWAAMQGRKGLKRRNLLLRACYSIAEWFAWIWKGW